MLVLVLIAGILVGMEYFEDGIAQQVAAVVMEGELRIPSTEPAVPELEDGMIAPVPGIEAPSAPSGLLASVAKRLCQGSSAHWYFYRMSRDQVVVEEFAGP